MRIKKLLQIIIGLHVQGQVFFPSGLTLRCYDADSTCTTVTNFKEFNYAEDGEFQRSHVVSFNICCFSNTDYFPNNYYAVTGSKCQRCSGDECFS